MRWGVEACAGRLYAEFGVFAADCVVKKSCVSLIVLWVALYRCCTGAFQASARLMHLFVPASLCLHFSGQSLRQLVLYKMTPLPLSQQ